MHCKSETSAVEGSLRDAIGMVADFDVDPDDSECLIGGAVTGGGENGELDFEDDIEDCAKGEGTVLERGLIVVYFLSS
jgi:copper chaperone CopZ